MSNDFSIVPSHLAVKAMRDSGYKNIAYALAELIDNSIQAGATHVEVLLAERYERVVEREKRRIYQIGVMDNGGGMTADVLRMALQFGNGTRLNNRDRTGMGRFGMGLPSASISQCRRVEVWTWQGDITRPFYTYLDLDDIENQRTREIPIPQIRAIPKIWLDMSETTSGTDAKGSGTLVVWSNIDRSNWVTSKAIIMNSEFVVGRMYRYFLFHNKVRITLRNFEVEVPDQTQQMRWIYHEEMKNEYNHYAMQPNDPLHLMPYHGLAAPWNAKALFEPYGDKFEQIVEIPDNDGVAQRVRVLTTIARKEAREGDLAGARDYGKHVAKNMGISIVRAGRELEMDEGLLIQHDPVERWWGMEIQFAPALDEVFGVTNNKQTAVKLREALSHKTPSDRQAFYNDINDEYTPLKPLLRVIDATLTRVRAALKDQKTGERTRVAREPESVSYATKAILNRSAEGHPAPSDAKTQKDDVSRVREITGVLTGQGMPAPDAQKTATEIVTKKRRVLIDERRLDSSMMFSVRDLEGVLYITINTDHPMHMYLYEMIDAEKRTPVNDKERLNRARIALQMLLFSWARMEDESIGNSNRASELRRIREEWGDMTRSFLETLDESR
jgi:hypothetical protein